MPSYVRATTVAVPENFGQRLRQLRKERSWSQDELVRRTALFDQHDHRGVSKRRIGAIERNEASKFERRTIELLAQTFDLSLNQLIDWPLSYLLSSPPTNPTTLFRSIFDQLLEKIKKNNRLIIIEGKSGSGKSRVAASLFELDQDIYHPFWFSGATIKDLNESVISLNDHFANNSNKPLIILDEDYSLPTRNAVFFVDLFQSPLLLEMLNSYILVCNLRRSTYLRLGQQDVLSKADFLSLDNHPDDLNDYQAWGLDQPLRQNEREWICELLKDDTGQVNLNSFLIDKICIPAVRYNRWRNFNCQEKQIVETVYHGLVRRQESRVWQLCIASYWVQEMSVKPSLWLVVAVFRQQFEHKNITVSQVTNMMQIHDLTSVHEDTFFNREPTWKNINYTSFGFSSNLFRETTGSKVSLSDIELERVVEELINIIEQSEVSLITLTESVVSWLGLVGRQKKGFPSISAVISNLAGQLIDSGQLPAITVGRKIFAMCWFFCSDHLSDRLIMQESTIFQDLERVTQSITSRFEPEDVIELCRMRPDGGSAYPLVDSFTGWLAGFAVRSRQIETENFYFWSMAESKISALSSMAEHLTEDKDNYHRLKIDSEKRAYIHLLAWAGKYEPAGDAITEMIRASLSNQKLIQQSIGWSNQAITAYFKAEAMDKIHNLLDLLSNSYQDKTTNQFFQAKLDLISSSRPTSLFDLEWQSADLANYQPDRSVIVLQNPINQSAFEVAHHLNTLGIGYHLVESALFSDLTDLPVKGKFVILGNGYIGRHGDLIDDYLNTKTKTTKTKRFTWQEFQVVHRELVWIRGGWEQATLEGVRNWLLSEDCQKFLDS